MTESQYLSLCEACDNVLGSDASPPDRVAIPWLHVIREHPATVSPHEWLFRPAASGGRYARRFLAGVLTSIRRLVKSVLTGRMDGPPPGVRSCDILFVSHLTTRNQLGDRDDPYFGSLPRELADSGESVVIAMIDHTERIPASAASAWGAGTVPRIILSSVMRLSAELDSTRRLLRASRGLHLTSLRARHGLTRTVASYAGAGALASDASNAMRISKQVERLAGMLRPRAIVITYEGHAWERVAMAAARRAVPGVRCVAYQHAALSRLSHAPTRGLGSPYDPDIILAAGDVARRRFKRSPGLGVAHVEVVGSNRGFAHPRPSPGESARGNVCLVLPEGYPSECLRLFLFSLDCARARPDVEFIWRLHPMTRMEDLVTLSSRLRDLPRNVSLSSSPLSADATRSRLALYRGSTAIVQAVGAGAVPVYLHRRGEMTIDPLFELDESRPIIEAPEDLNALIDRASFGISQEAWDHCASMFAPFDVEVMRRAVAGSRTVEEDVR